MLMDGIGLIQDLAIVLLTAGIAGTLCRRLGLSVIVGYLVAGIVIGPFTPPFSFVQDVERIQTLSQVGLVFLMFGIGLGLSLSRLGRMGWPTLFATGLGALLMLVLTQALGRLIGWTPTQAMFMAAMFMVSSSAVIAKIVGELNLTHERSGQVALSVTLLEDIVAVCMLTILASHARGGGGPTVSGVLTGMTAFVVLLVGAGLLMVPRLMRGLEARADPELQTIIVAGLLFTLSLAAVKAGYSLALGAFLLGAIVAEIPQKTAVERSFTGMKDLFSSVFFVSIGMMIDLKLVLPVWPMILGLTVFVIVGRAIATGLALILCGARPKEARRAGLLLTPLGEFSFIIAQLGVSTAVLPESYYPLSVGVSILTVLLVPSINRHAEAILRVAERIEPSVLQRIPWLVGTSAIAAHQLDRMETDPRPPAANRSGNSLRDGGDVVFAAGARVAVGQRGHVRSGTAEHRLGVLEHDRDYCPGATRRDLAQPRGDRDDRRRERRQRQAIARRGRPQRADGNCRRRLGRLDLCDCPLRSAGNLGVGRHRGDCDGGGRDFFPPPHLLAQ
jgi:CPA2 family monovalent cation:H+ antiporter-2